LTLVFVLSFAAFYSWRVLRFTRAVSQLWRMHEFFQELLGIPESDIQTVPWHVIVSRVTALKGEHPATQQTASDPASSNHPSVSLPPPPRTP
jgi:autophagy-related protein 9